MVRFASRVAATLLLALILVNSAGRLVAATEGSLGCDGFAIQSAAQAALDADLTDPGRLDTDFDGLACEADQPRPAAREAPGFGTPGLDTTAAAPAPAAADAAAAQALPPPSDGMPSGTIRARVVRIVDGQTITVEVDDPADPAFGQLRTVRLAGIAAGAGAAGGSGCLVEESARRFEEMLPTGRTVYLEPEAARDAASGERYVWFKGKDDGKPYLANEILVREGFALVVASPDAQHLSRLNTAQADAATAGTGLWATCPEVVAPSSTSA